jgi:hypothetical protein
MLWAREQPWGARGRSIASAGLLALLNAVPGVAICLNAGHVPDNCFNSGFNYSESVTFGDAINGNPRFIGIWGSSHAPFPLKNTRYGTVSPSSATVFNNALNTCTTALVEGRTETWARYPQHCRANGMTYHDPVHVLTPRHPNTWYYGEPAPVTPPVTPSGANQWPQPM